MDFFNIPASIPLQAENAGYFVSSGIGCHPDRTITSHELIFVRSGTLYMAEGNRSFEVCKNESLILWPGRRHLGTCDYSKDLSFYWVHFQTKKNSRCTFPVPQHGKIQTPERMTDLFRRFLDDQESGSQDLRKASLQIALMLLEIQPSSKIEPRVNALACRTHDYIQTHFREGIHAGDIAQAFGYNHDYLGRIYQHVYGHTLSSAIHQCQLHEAKSLLRDTAFNFDEVAARCGFGTTRYFRKLFAKQMGMTPRDYRRLYARVYINTR